MCCVAWPDCRLGSSSCPYAGLRPSRFQAGRRCATQRSTLRHRYRVLRRFFRWISPPSSTRSYAVTSLSSVPSDPINLTSSRGLGAGYTLSCPAFAKLDLAVFHTRSVLYADAYHIAVIRPHKISLIRGPGPSRPALRRQPRRLRTTTISNQPSTRVVFPPTLDPYHTPRRSCSNRMLEHGCHQCAYPRVCDPRSH